MLNNINQIITWCISIGALTLSITTIIITRRNLKKQLRLIKLEEILEILHYLSGYYHSQLNMFNRLETKLLLLKEKKESPIFTIEYKKYRDGFLEGIDREKITNKISRLKILSNAYLSNTTRNNLKIRIHTLSDIYYKMYLFIYSEGTYVEKQDDAIIPNAEEMRHFIDNIENDVIMEMKLGYKAINEKKQEKYYQTQFKKDIKIDNENKT